MWVWEETPEDVSMVGPPSDVYQSGAFFISKMHRAIHQAGHTVL